MTRGKFITLEGVDGAGKSTHQKFIADFAATRAPHVVQTREPGGTDLAERLRESILKTTMTPEVETLLIFAARADHVAKVIRPALDTGQWVVCDRFTDATYAYQGAGKGVSLELIGRLGDAVHPGLRPDRTLVFDCPYEIARKRLQGKTLDRFEREDREFFERVREHYLVRARADTARVRVIDATMELGQIRNSVESALSGL